MLPTLLALACASAPPVAPEPPPAPAPAPAAPTNAPRGNIGGEPILDRPVILGAIANQAVEGVIGDHLAAIQGCLAASDAATRSGKVLVKFTITMDGSVSEPHVRSSSLRHAATEACVLAEVSKIKFPALQGGTKALVTYPFSFP